MLGCSSIAKFGDKQKQKKKHTVLEQHWGKTGEESVRGFGVVGGDQYCLQRFVVWPIRSLKERGRKCSNGVKINLRFGAQEARRGEGGNGWRDCDAGDHLKGMRISTLFNNFCMGSLEKYLPCNRRRLENNMLRLAHSGKRLLRKALRRVGLVDGQG